jgi:cytochrome P450
VRQEPSASDVDWRPNAAWADVETSPTEGTSARYRELLLRCPVAHIPADGVPGEGRVDYWAVLGFDELAAAVRDFKTFSSVTPQAGPRILPLQSDPPEHAHYRRPLNRYFDSAAVAAKEEEVAPIAAAMIDSMLDAGTADFVDAYADPFPTRVLCRFLGVDDEDWRTHHDWVMAMEEATGDGLADNAEAVPQELAMRILPYVQKVVAARRAEPRDDIVSGMVALEVDGRRLEDMEVCFLVITFMLAGHITTTSGVGNLILRLAADRDLQDLLRANPERIPDALEESLRIDTPQQAMPRRCAVDVEIGGHKIAAGERVLFNYGSANVDPDHWERPDVFDLDRVDKRHLAFGRGIHMCMGAPLARMEIALTARELLARTDSFEVAGPVKRCAWPRLAVERLPLAFRPASCPRRLGQIVGVGGLADAAEPHDAVQQLQLLQVDPQIRP